MVWLIYEIQIFIIKMHILMYLLNKLHYLVLLLIISILHNNDFQGYVEKEKIIASHGRTLAVFLSSSSLHMVGH